MVRSVADFTSQEVLHRRFPRIGSGRGPGGRRYFFWRTRLTTYRTASPVAARVSNCLVSRRFQHMLDVHSASHVSLESVSNIILKHYNGVIMSGDGISNFRRPDSLLNSLFRHGSKKTAKLRVTGLCEGKPPRPVDSPHKGPVTRKMFPFDGVIMKKGQLLVR